ncbi:hypothetical protein [Frankia sp. AgB32]|uniref:hypothetical protein n=1 Tax=Frankia sp. AgB32 TaxID=631119 RepID=UPI002010460C|nr:hypothetical protein [Frankia sp. AgB32]MCK9897245.1 hypothetical protein [Frankia sp. AgB32]
MTLSGARPRGPRPELENKTQLKLLQHLHALNRPYRVSYEMVVCKVWSDHDDGKIRRARARDLSRQFRGEKQIEWEVIENYVELLFPDDQTQRAAHLDRCRPLHHDAFGSTPAQDDPGPGPGEVDPAYVAELERQLAETRTRAAFATALLVIVRSENAVLRGRHASFGWFRSRGEIEEAECADPATAPIRRPGDGHHHQWGSRPLVALTDLIGEQLPVTGRQLGNPRPRVAAPRVAMPAAADATARRPPDPARLPTGPEVVRSRRGGRAGAAEPDILTAGPERRRRGGGH